MKLPKKLIFFTLFLLVFPLLFSGGAFAQDAQEKKPPSLLDQCKQDIRNALSGDTEDVENLKKEFQESGEVNVDEQGNELAKYLVAQQQYMENGILTPTSEMVPQVMENLRNFRKRLLGICAGVVVYSSVGRAEQNPFSSCGSVKESGDRNEAVSYCKEVAGDTLTMARQFLPSFVLRDAQKKKTSFYADKYRNLNQRLRSLVDDFSRFAQNVSKFNSLLGGFITGECLKK